MGRGEVIAGGAWGRGVSPHSALGPGGAFGLEDLSLEGFHDQTVPAMGAQALVFE